MLSDPFTVTVDGSARVLNRKSIADGESQPKILGKSFYSLADNSYYVSTRQALYRDGSRRSEIHLGKTTADTDVATAAVGVFNTSVGIVFTTNAYGIGNSGIPGLRADLLAVVDSVLQNRIIGGEH